MSSREISVFVTTRVEGFHYWESAPKEVEFLRHPHRHEFHIRAEFEVSHTDRDIEFILAKRVVETYFNENPIKGKVSCEDIGISLGAFLSEKDFPVRSVEVSEDGENGAVIRWN